MRAGNVPIVVLAGSDRRPSAMPDGTDGLHQLTGYKGVDIRISGRPLLEVVIERLEQSGCFGEIYVAGPARAYQPLRLPARMIDTDSGFGDNIRAAVEAVRYRHPGSPIAFITCDVIPDPQSLPAVWELYLRDAPCGIWWPIVRIQDDSLGASSWKPTYSLAAGPGETPQRVLGSHLVVGDPDALRLDVLCRIFDLAYGSRNRSIYRRRSVIVRNAVGQLVREDLRRLFSLRWPGLTWTLVRAGVRGARQARSGRMTLAQLDRGLADIFVKRAYRKTAPGTITRLIDDLHLALDIDTEEEARAHGGDVAAARGGS